MRRRVSSLKFVALGLFALAACGVGKPGPTAPGDAGAFELPTTTDAPEADTSYGGAGGPGGRAGASAEASGGKGEGGRANIAGQAGVGTDALGGAAGSPEETCGESPVLDPGATGATMLFNASDASAPVVAGSPDGSAIAVWQALYTCRPSEIAVWDFVLWGAHFTPGGGWGKPTVLSSERSDAPSAPSLAMSEDGQAIVVWRHFRSIPEVGFDVTVRALRFVPGQGWGSPTIIGPSDAGSWDATVAMSASGGAIASWSHRPAGTYETWLNRFVPATGWQSPLIIGEGAPGTVAMNQAGQALVAWNGESPTYRRFDPVSGWGDELTVSAGTPQASYDPQVALDLAGRAVMLWQQYQPATSYLAWRATDDPAIGWTEPTLLGSPGSSQIFNFRVAMNAGGRGIAAWPDGLGVTAATFDLDTGIWSEPIDLGAGDVDMAGVPDIAMNVRGEGVVGWHQFDGADRPSVWVRRLSAEGAWLPARRISARSQVEAMAPRVTLDALGRALAVWIEMDRSDHYSVWTAWLPD